MHKQINLNKNNEKKTNINVFNKMILDEKVRESMYKFNKNFNKTNLLKKS